MGKILNRVQYRAMQKAAAGIKLLSPEQQRQFVENNLKLIPQDNRRILVEDNIRKDLRKFGKKGKTVEAALDAICNKLGTNILAMANIDRDMLESWAKEDGCK